MSTLLRSLCCSAATRGSYQQYAKTSPPRRLVRHRTRSLLAAIRRIETQARRLPRASRAKTRTPRRRSLQSRADRFTGKSDGSRTRFSPRRCGHHFPARHDLRAKFDGLARRAAGQSPCHHPQPATGRRARLQGVQQNRRPHENDRRMAGPLRSLSGARDRQRLQPRSHRVSSGHRHPATRRSGLAGNRRLDRGGARGEHHGPQPPRAHGPLLQRHARHSYRYDAPNRLFRRTPRNRRGRRTGGSPSRRHGGGNRGQARRVPPVLRHPT